MARCGTLRRVMRWDLVTPPMLESSLASVPGKRSLLILSTPNLVNALTCFTEDTYALQPQKKWCRFYSLPTCDKVSGRCHCAAVAKGLVGGRQRYR